MARPPYGDNPTVILRFIYMINQFGISSTVSKRMSGELDRWRGTVLYAGCSKDYEININIIIIIVTTVLALGEIVRNIF